MTRAEEDTSLRDTASAPIYRYVGRAAIEAATAVKKPGVAKRVRSSAGAR